MKRQIHLWREEALQADGELTVSVTIEHPEHSRKRLWYRLLLDYSSFITPSFDSFVVATLLTAMSQSTDLVVHGEVSPSLLQNLAEFQAAWTCWCPEKYQSIAILAEVEREQPQDNISKAISAFSGGVDSCFTAFRHRKADSTRVQRPLKAGLMVHWIGRPLKQQQVFNLTTKKSKAMLDSLGMELIPMATNFRELMPHNWDDFHGSAIASCLMLLQRGYTSGLIASSDPYHALNLPYGSNPITDPLLSSNTFQILHDGAAFTRIEKIREISQWPEALENLMVCWEGSQADRNCGRCEKCIRTILGFRVMGIDLPACFEQDPTDHQVFGIKALKKSQLIELYPILAAAKAADISDTWVKALDQCIKRNQILSKLKELRTALKKH
jgi:hypothetical protein